MVEQQEESAEHVAFRFCDDAVAKRCAGGTSEEKDLLVS